MILSKTGGELIKRFLVLFAFALIICGLFVGSMLIAHAQDNYVYTNTYWVEKNIDLSKNYDDRTIFILHNAQYDVVRTKIGKTVQTDAVSYHNFYSHNNGDSYTAYAYIQLNSGLNAYDCTTSVAYDSINHQWRSTAYAQRKLLSKVKNTLHMSQSVVDCLGIDELITYRVLNENG